MKYDPILIDIEETYRKGVFYYLIFLFIIFIFVSYFLVILIIGGFQFFTFFLFVILVGVILFLLLNFLYEYSIFKDKRKIIISEDQILIKIPNHPLFQLFWDNFNTLVIKQKKKEPRIRKYSGFKLKFIKETVIQSIEISEYLHFKKERLEEIIKILRNKAKQNGKEVNLILYRD
ncbi:MAG: hypothetical protein ACTSR8_00585 [Promethearchaeota archaeon]